MSAEKLASSSVEKFKYEWSIGYRLDHWAIALSIFALAFTGFYIHWPFIAGGPNSTIMGWMRFVHFVSMYVLVVAFVVRIYLAFNSRFDADWRDFGIIRNIKGIPDALKYYLFISPTHPEYRKYNPLQALAYLLWGLSFIWMALTGFALYHGRFFGLFDSYQGFIWMNNFLGGEAHTRLWHFGTMWFIIIVFAIHKYLGIRQTLLDGDHTFQSIFTGYKLKK